MVCGDALHVVRIIPRDIQFMISKGSWDTLRYGSVALAVHDKLDILLELGLYAAIPIKAVLVS